MSNVAVLKSAPAPSEYLGPANVVEVRGRELLVEIPASGLVSATIALAFPYEPVPGDVLLIIGRGGDYYGIGVLHGTGRTALSFHGDVDLRAHGGALNLSGDQGVVIAGPEVSVHASKLQMVADAVVQRFASVYQRVSAMLSVHAKETHTVVDETAYTQSKSGVILTEETMSINGKKIHIGC